MNRIIGLCFIFPFVFSACGLQGWLILFLGLSMAQLITYMTLVTPILGTILLFTFKENKAFSPLARNWILFYLVYYILAVIASFYHMWPINFMSSFFSVVYALTFMVFFRFEEFQKLFANTAMISFTIANVTLIIFQIYQIDYDTVNLQDDIEHGVERAQGVYGDANNAALVCILGFVFLYMKFIPKNIWQKTLKLTLLIVSFYALLLTLSTTGLLAFILVFALLNYKWFTKNRLLLMLIMAPIVYTLLLQIEILTAHLDLSVHQQHKIRNLVNLLSFNMQEVDFSGRSELVENLMVYLRENPFFGRGLDFGLKARVHNTFLYIWADAGILALIVFVSMLLIYFKNILFASMSVKIFSASIMVPLVIFMASLQTIINQPYLMPVFIYVAYILTEDKNRVFKTPNVQSFSYEKKNKK
ncbi:MAG: O-antigen ligase family protein [Flavobacteriaceae bacterium]|nr:O-antigen ligase family protein [Flavobacteriaceae bacterium]